MNDVAGFKWPEIDVALMAGIMVGQGFELVIRGIAQDYYCFRLLAQRNGRPCRMSVPQLFDVYCSCQETPPPQFGASSLEH